MSKIYISLFSFTIIHQRRNSVHLIENENDAKSKNDRKDELFFWNENNIYFKTNKKISVKKSFYKVSHEIWPKKSFAILWNAALYNLALQIYFAVFLSIFFICLLFIRKCRYKTNFQYLFLGCFNSFDVFL